MHLPQSFKPSPWDTIAFGIVSYEISQLSEELLKLATTVPGHYSIRVDPLVSKAMLHEFGFYYCDTLIEPYGRKDRIMFFRKAGVECRRDYPLAPILDICDGAFVHGRFHRDFRLASGKADQRYITWLKQLYTTGQVYAILYQKELAGFIAVVDNRLVLHALAIKFRGQGLAKHFWTPVCEDVISKGFSELTSSVSTTNLAVMNLYSSLGFRFRRPVDIYHRLTS